MEVDHDVGEPEELPKLMANIVYEPNGSTLELNCC
jgi:hypothetical protein